MGLRMSEVNSLPFIIYFNPKVPITTAADGIHKKKFRRFSEKIRLDVAWQRIHLTHQASFSLNDKSKKLKCRLLQFLFGALRVNSQVQKSFELHCSLSARCTGWYSLVTVQ